MDVITTAIVAALANLSKDVIKDTYNGLKSALKKKFGSESDLIDAVDKLEKRPDSEGRKATLQEEVAITKINEDPEIVRLAQDLLEKFQEQPEAQQIITQNLSHNKYAATSVSGHANISGITEHGTSKDN
ncbi:MAG: hypothetical protein F6K41_28520 [Symploca sp. SIO3E6]|nr:hypothetical protein [Caldora sp. SIO3E6]